MVGRGFWLALVCRASIRAPVPLIAAQLSQEMLAFGHTDASNYIISLISLQVCVDADGECFVAAAAGEHHTLVVTQYGDVKTFGRGREGQLGHGEDARQDSDVPRKVRARIAYGDDAVAQSLGWWYRRKVFGLATEWS